MVFSPHTKLVIGRRVEKHTGDPRPPQENPSAKFCLGILLGNLISSIAVLHLSQRFTQFHIHHVKHSGSWKVCGHISLPVHKPTCTKSHTLNGRADLFRYLDNFAQSSPWCSVLSNVKNWPRGFLRDYLGVSPSTKISLVYNYRNPSIVYSSFAHATVTKFMWYF